MFTMPKRKRRSFTKEQKADAVRMVREIGNVAKVARDLDLTESALRNWGRKADIDDGHGPEGALTSEEQEELLRLRRRVKTFEMERDFARRAAAFFTKEIERRTRRRDWRAATRYLETRYRDQRARRWT